MGDDRLQKTGENSRSFQGKVGEKERKGGTGWESPAELQTVQGKAGRFSFFLQGLEQEILSCSALIPP